MSFGNSLPRKFLGACGCVFWLSLISQLLFCLAGETYGDLMQTVGTIRVMHTVSVSESNLFYLSFHKT